MDNVKIDNDFISAYLKTERKMNDKNELEKKLSLDENQSSQGQNFLDKVFEKLDPDKDDSKIKDISVSADNIFLNKEKQNLSFLANNSPSVTNGLSYLSTASSDKLQENSKILDEILDKLKNQN